MAKPECRFCGTRVAYFGDVCSDCEGADDTLLRIARDDAAQLAPDDTRDEVLYPAWMERDPNSERGASAPIASLGIVGAFTAAYLVAQVVDRLSELTGAL